MLWPLDITRPQPGPGAFLETRTRPVYGDAFVSHPKKASGVSLSAAAHTSGLITANKPPHPTKYSQSDKHSGPKHSAHASIHLSLLAHVMCVGWIYGSLHNLLPASVCIELEVVFITQFGNVLKTATLAFCSSKPSVLGKKIKIEREMGRAPNAPFFFFSKFLTLLPVPRRWCGDGIIVLPEERREKSVGKSNHMPGGKKKKRRIRRL